MNRWLVCVSAAAGLAMLAGCSSQSSPKKGDYAAAVNASGTTGMKGTGSFAAGSNSHPGYVEFPLDVGAKASLAPTTGNHAPVTALAEGSRGPGIANDSGNLGIGAH